jgi:hypothetical protein
MFKVLYDIRVCIFFWHISERKHKIPQPVSASMVMASVAKAQLLSPNALHHLNLPELR